MQRAIVTENFCNGDGRADELRWVGVAVDIQYDIYAQLWIGWGFEDWVYLKWDEFRFLEDGDIVAKRYQITRIARAWFEAAGIPQNSVYEKLRRYCKKIGREKPYELGRHEAIRALDVTWAHYPPPTLKYIHCRQCGKAIPSLHHLCEDCERREYLTPRHITRSAGDYNFPA